MSRRLSRNVLVFGRKLLRLIEHVVRHDVACFDPALGRVGIARLHAQPAFFSRVVTGIRDVGGVEYVNHVAAIDLQKVSGYDRSRTANLSAASNNHARAVPLSQRLATKRQQNNGENDNSLTKSHSSSFEVFSIAKPQRTQQLFLFSAQVSADLQLRLLAGCIQRESIRRE